MRHIKISVFVLCIVVFIFAVSQIVEAEVEAPIYDLEMFDRNADGFLEVQGVIKSGDIIFRSSDRVTAVEEGEYLVPNNIYFIDQDGDNVLDSQIGYSRLVIVMRDNLTYLFQPESSYVMGIFPNGVGSAGSNSVASIRRVNVRLGESWGIEYSQHAGYEQNMFGSITLGTAYIIDANPSHDVDTFQEVHGTPENLEFLLGREISGGCVRHSNRSIGFIAQNVAIGEVVLTVESAQDDDIDNPLNLYQRTRRAARMPLVEIPFTAEEIGLSFIARPANMSSSQIDLSTITDPVWANFDQIDIPRYPVAEHPFTRGDYQHIPCGTETFYISELINGRDRLIEVAPGRFRLDIADEIEGLGGMRIQVSDFYNDENIGIQEILDNLTAFSGGDIRIAYFQYLVWDYSYQYAKYVAQRDSNSELEGINLILAVSHLTNSQLREVQFVTGLIPVRYSYLTPGPDGLAGEVVAASLNRTVEHRLMNIFYGHGASVYELDFRPEPNHQAYLLEDVPMNRPSIDHELTRAFGVEPSSIADILSGAIRSNHSIIFRITAYRYQTMPISTAIGLSANHYFAFIPEYSDIDAGYIAVQDSMHPYDLLFIPVNEIADVFSTVTVSP